MRQKVKLIPFYTRVALLSCAMFIFCLFYRYIYLFMLPLSTLMNTKYSSGKKKNNYNYLNKKQFINYY